MSLACSTLQSSASGRSCCHTPSSRVLQPLRLDQATTLANGHLSPKSNLHALSLQRPNCRRRQLQRCCCTSQSLAKTTRSRRGLIQHKEEAFWFYRFLSIVYDKIVNPGHWTVDMRTDALEPANLNDANLKVVTDVQSALHMFPMSCNQTTRPVICHWAQPCSLIRTSRTSA